MRVFNEQVFDLFVTGAGTSVYSPPDLNALLGAADSLNIFAYVNQSSGTTPTITVQVEHSGDQIHWLNRNATAEINAASIVNPPGDFSLVGYDGNPTSRAGLAFARLRVSLAGTGSVAAYVRIWVTGRDTGK